MGRIYEALRRSNLDVARPAEAPAHAPESSPWPFEKHQSGDGHEPAARSASPVPTEAPADRHVPGEVRRPARRSPWPVRRGRFDTDACERLVVSTNAEPLLIEQFRSLAATLHQVHREPPVKSVIVTSASPADGKSHVAANLALTLSDSYRRRVLLIDADLRRPSLHLLFQVSNTRGLSEALKAPADEKVTTLQISETLALLPAGRPEPDPLGGLSSDRMKRILEDGVSRFDWVIVDAPPVGVLADGRLVLEIVDGAILVVRAGVTRFPDVEAAAETLGHERIIGVVLNAVEPAEIRSKDYYQYYYGSHRRDG